MKKFALAVSAFSALTLTACVSQEQADAKMIEGCKGALTVMMQPKTIKEVQKTSAEDTHTEGSIYREVKITYVENEDFAGFPKEASCLFAQDWGLFKASHTAVLNRLTIGDQVIGKKDGKIIGSMDDFMKLTDGAETAMGQ